MNLDCISLRKEGDALECREAKTRRGRIFDERRRGMITEAEEVEAYS